MAPHTIEIKQQLRPCYVKGEKALFHRWADRADTFPASRLTGGPPGGQYWEVFGIVETENGRISKVPSGAIRFIDTKAYMDGIAWPEPEEG